MVPVDAKAEVLPRHVGKWEPPVGGIDVAADEE